MKYISVRVVDADNHEQAIQQVIEGCFDESDNMCDKVVPFTAELEKALISADQLNQTGFKVKQYSLFEPNEYNMIGTIEVTTPSEFKTMIEKACNPHFDGECTIEQAEIENNICYLTKQPYITLEISVVDNGEQYTRQIGMCETWLYKKEN